MYRNQADLALVSQRVVDVTTNIRFVTFYKPDKDAAPVEMDDLEEMRGYGKEKAGKNVYVWDDGDSALQDHPTLIITATKEGAKVMYKRVKGRADYCGFIDAAAAEADARAQQKADLKAAELRRVDRAVEADAVKPISPVLAATVTASQAFVFRCAPYRA